MLWAISDAAWRAVLLLALGVAPYASPVEAIGARSSVVAIVRLAIFVALVVCVTLAVRRMGRTHPLSAALCALTALALPIAAALASGSRGPLARAALPVSALVWLTLAAVSAGPLAAAIASRRMKPLARARRVAAALPAIAVGVSSIALAAPRLTPRTTLWRHALAIDPGNEAAATAVADDLRSRHDAGGALAMLLTCARARHAQCRCAEHAAALAIDFGKFTDARTALDASSTCTATPKRIALGAEATLGSGDLGEGRRVADVAFALDPNDSHAVYARAWAEMLAGEADRARADAQRAVDLGRGETANMLLGLLLFRANDLAGAEAQFRGALAASPDDARAVYDIALIADRRGQYHDAREGYLHALRLDPSLADARYNLAVLTYSRGALQEAQHHVDELAASYPKDSRIGELRRMLATPPPRPAMTLGH